MLVTFDWNGFSTFAFQPLTILNYETDHPPIVGQVI